MEPATIFAALGHPGRLAVFRLLMRFAPQGVRPTEIARALELRANTLSHHLADLEAAGLIASTRRGRSLFYAVRLERVAGLVSYLVEDAGRGRADLAASVQRPPIGDRPWNVLFLCSANSARSILAEALLRDLGQGDFRAFSAGTRPGPAPHPHALSLLARQGHDISALRPKSLTDFAGPQAPRMDFVFTVCDLAAAEDCAPWPGRPMAAHWGLPDPAQALGSAAEIALAFAQTYDALRRRIEAFVALPLAALERVALQHRLDQIGTR